MFSRLLGTGALIFPATKRLHLKRKQNDPEQFEEYLKLHQSAELELKSLRIGTEVSAKNTKKTGSQCRVQITSTIGDKKAIESKT